MVAKRGRMKRRGKKGGLSKGRGRKQGWILGIASLSTLIIYNVDIPPFQRQHPNPNW